MYTATIREVVLDKERKNFQITVGFSDGIENHINIFTFPFGTKKIRVLLELKRYVQELETSVVDVAEIQKGFVDLSAISEPIQTQTETDLNIWLTDYRKLCAAQKLIDLSVLTGSETAIVNLRNKVKNSFDVAYIGNII